MPEQLSYTHKVMLKNSSHWRYLPNKIIVILLQHKITDYNLKIRMSFRPRMHCRHVCTEASVALITRHKDLTKYFRVLSQTFILENRKMFYNFYVKPCMSSK